MMPQNHEPFAKVQALIECVKDKLSVENHSNTIVRSALAELVKLSSSMRDDVDQETADALDEHGVMLWNASISLRHFSEGNPAAEDFVVDVRLAAVSLLDAGLRDRADVESTSRLVTAYSSLLSVQSNAGRRDFNAALSRASQLVKSLPSLESCGSNTKVAAQIEDARRALECGTFDVNFAQGKYDVGQKQLTALLDSLPSSSLTIAKSEPIWRRCFQLGQQLLLQLPEPSISIAEGDTNRTGLDEEDMKSCKEAIKWLQKGISLQERAGVTGSIMIRPLLQLAYAYYLGSASDKSALASADATLSEASRLLQAEAVVDNELKEHIAFMRFRVTSRHGNDSDQSRALETLCSTLAFNEAVVMKVLDFVSGLAKRMLPAGFRIVIRAMLKSDQADIHQHVATTLLRAVFLLTDAAAISQLDALLDDISSSKVSLPQDAVCAAQLMIWRRADALYKKQLFEHAADMHMLATHQAFSNMPDNVAKSARRVAVCYLAMHQPDTVKDCIELCPEPYKSSAASQLCVFLAAIQLANEDDALQAFQKLVRAPDMEPQTLIEVVEEAQKAHMDKVLQAGLENLLDAIKVDAQLEASVDILALHHTLVSIFLPSDDKNDWSEQQAGHLVTYLRQSLKALKSRMDEDEDACQHLEWLWKHAYNSAVRASHSLDAVVSASVFDVAFDLMEERHRFSHQAPDQAIVVACWVAKFASVEVATTSIQDLEDPAEKKLLYQEMHEQIELAEKLRKAAHAVDPAAAPAEAEWALRLILLQLAVNVQDWSGLAESLKLLEDTIETVPFKIVESYVHTLNTTTDVSVPVEISVQSLELLIKRYSVESTGMTLTGTMRYHRLLLLVVLQDENFSRPELRRKALSSFTLIRDALLQAQRDEQEAFQAPEDETMWLLAQAWQKGTELAMTAKLDEARMFSEVALSLSGMLALPDATKRRMETHYEALLRRMSQAPAVSPFPKTA